MNRQKAEETNSQEEEDEETRKGEAEEGVGVVAEELNEGEVKEGKRESSLAKYAEDEKHRLAVVNVQRHARGCLARKKMRRKVEDELERLGMLVLNKDDASSTRTKKMKMKMNVCVDSRSRSTARAAGSEEEDKDDDTEEDIETKIELLREKRLREFEQNQPHVYERTKKALLEEHGSKIETFVREYRETHQGALPELKDIPIILDDSNERKKEDKDDEMMMMMSQKTRQRAMKIETTPKTTESADLKPCEKYSKNPSVRFQARRRRRPHRTTTTL